MTKDIPETLELEKELIRWLRKVWSNVWLTVLPRALQNQTPMYLNYRTTIAVNNVLLEIELPDHNHISFSFKLRGELSSTERVTFIAEMLRKITVTMENVNRCARREKKLAW